MTFRQDLIYIAAQSYLRDGGGQSVSDFLDDFTQRGWFPAMNAVRISAGMTWDEADDALDALSWTHLVKAVERAVSEERRWL